MLAQVTLSILLGLVAAAPAPHHSPLSKRATAYSLPFLSNNNSVRAAAISIKQDGFTYGSSPVSDEVNSYPAGVLGDARWLKDIVELSAEVAEGQVFIKADAAKAAAALPSVSSYPKSPP